MRSTRSRERSILVPIANPETADQLVSTAADLATDQQLALELLTVVEVPDQLPLSEGERLVDDEREILTYASDLVDPELDVSSRIRFARSISSGILSAAEDRRVRTILVGWRGRPRRRDLVLGSHLDEVLRDASCDVLVQRMDRSEELERILLPVAGGPNTELAATVAGSLARVHDAAVHVVTVHAPGDATQQQRQREETLARVIADFVGVSTITQEILESGSTVDAIVEQSSNCDLVVLGAASDGLFRRSLVGSLPEQIGRESSSSVIMAKRHRTLPSRFARLVSRLG
ncbi:universal stress protein [Haloprofundus halophilus]|uniref:universal stress protein n=1 Tax=Haloprofundus halophilus TaxID=2283527 RepID=UPI000E446AF7|nr:universal stress protein [Haloprofundus halophilus]